jgi:hypothetical protein
MKKTPNTKIVLLLSLVFAFDKSFTQPIGYPVEPPDGISNCQIDANCTLGNSLSNLKDAIGLLYYELHSSSYSAYKGTVSIIRKAGGGGIIMTAGHAYSFPPDYNWIRYLYKASCGGLNPSSVEKMVHFDPRYEDEAQVKDLLAIKLFTTDEGLITGVFLPKVGWSLLDNSGDDAKSLGHPEGNALKVTSYSNLSKSIHDFTSAQDIDVWVMSLSDGFAENGQSGSPVFNSSNYYIGSIVGIDNTSCNGSDPSGTVYAQRLSKYYRTFSNFLDPNHTGAVQIPTWLPGNIEVGEYKYPSLSKSASTLCYGNVAYVSINNYCEFMDDNVQWNLSNSSLVNTSESTDQRTLQISPKYSGSSGPLTNNCYN